MDHLPKQRLKVSNICVSIVCQKNPNSRSPDFRVSAHSTLSHAPLSDKSHVVGLKALESQLVDFELGCLKIHDYYNMI